MADALSRVDSIPDDNAGNPAAHLAEYAYLGLGGVVKVDYTEPDLFYTLVGGAGSDPYDGEGSATGGLDRFGRVVDLQWIDYAPNPDVVVEQIRHGYDRASNRLWRECPVPAALSPAKHYDELYTYDLLYQLKTFARGNLNGTFDGIVSGSKTLAQDWTLDNTGNWTDFKEDLDGNGAWDLEQTRVHNKANEVGAIGATTGTNWVDPVHDRAGNMITMPDGSDPTASRACSYDAWNRMTQWIDAATDTGARFAYDGLNRRTRAQRLVNAVVTETRHYYYSSGNRSRVAVPHTQSEQSIPIVTPIMLLILNKASTNRSRAA